MTQGWGTNGKASSHAAGRLWSRRIGITLLAAALAACLLWLLVRPLLHPRTHLVLLTGSVTGTNGPGEVPADFVLDDFRDLVGLRDVLHRSILDDGGPLILGSLQNQDEMQHLADRLNDRLSGRNDVVILYVSAHGFTQDGDAWLLASGADPHSPLGGRYRLASLLAQLRECEAETKILLLDAGRLDYDPLRGLVENDFPRRLVEQVEQLGDPRLWVMVSHGAGERSHLAPGWKRSVFGNFVAAGLKGAADANQDHTVDMAELVRYVGASVSGFVRQTTGGSGQQTPQAAWGGGSLDQSESPVLISVKKPAKEKTTEETANSQNVEMATDDPAENRTKREAEDRAERKLNSFIVSGIARSTPGGRLGHYANEAARRALSKTFGSLMPAGGEASEAKAPDAKTDGKEKTNGKEKADAKETTAARSADDKNGAKSDDTKSGDAKAKDGKSQPPANGASDSKEEPTVTRPEFAQSLIRAWQRRDELLASHRPAARPLDYAPSLWRELEQRLLAIDRKLRTGYIPNSNLDELNAELQMLLGDLEAIAAGKTADELPPLSLGRRLLESLPGRSLTHVKPRSLALAEALAREGGGPLTADEAHLAVTLDELIARGNRADLEKFVSDLKDAGDWYELTVVRQVAARPDLDWRLIQLLLVGLRQGERVAASVPASGPDVRPRIEEADTLWISAQRRMLYSPALDRDAVLSQLATARDAYQGILADLGSFHTARRLANDVRLRLPDYLAWNAGSSADEFGPTDAALLDLLDKLAALETELHSPASESFIAIQKSTAALAAARELAEQPSEPAVIERLLSAPVSTGESWKIQLLLETSLLNAAERQALTEVAAKVDAALTAEVKPPTETPTSRWPPIADPADDALFSARIQLANRWFETVSAGAVPADSTSIARRERLTANSSKSGPVIGTRARRDLECRQLQDLLRDLPAEIELAAAELADLSQTASRGSRREQLRHWKGTLALVDPRQNDHLSMASVAALNNAAGYDLLVWLADRAGRAVGDAPPQDAAYLREMMAGYRLAAESIPRQPSLRVETHDGLEISGPDSVTLTYLSQQDLNFRIRNLTSSHQSVWLAVDVNERLVQAASGNLRTVYSWAELNSASSPSANAVNLLDVVRQRSATLQLAPGQTAIAPLRVTRRGTANHPSHLVMRAITDASVARHDVTVKLPQPEDIALTIAGPITRWSPSASGIDLLPFPNRVNSFALEIASGKPDERQVDVDVLPILALPAAGIPPVPLSEADSQRLRSEISLGLSVAEAKSLTLPGGGRAVPIPLKKPVAIVPLPPADAAATPPAAKAPPAALAPPTPLPNGLLVVVTDLGTKQQTFRQLSISPQRPQRYIRPQVRYRAGRERIEITVSPQDGALLPTGGVRIHAELAESIPSEAERQLDGVLKPGENEAELFVQVDSSPGGFVTLRLTIDDYPRALYFRVPISGETSDVPEDLDLLAVRVMELPEGMVYKHPVGTIPVQAAIDAPASGSRNPPLRVEVGLDQNRDRELKGDQTVLLTTDRQVTAALVGVSKPGELEIDAKVTDFIVNVPAAGLGSGRMNVIAHAVFGDKDAWSEPIEISIDGLVPRVSAIEMRPAGSVTIGDPVLVSALADDAGLSGVAKVEAAFDRDRSGKFGPTTVPMAGALGNDGRWSISVPTAGLSSGTYNILVRATDKAGNESTFGRAPVRLVTGAEAELNAKKSTTADITGVVNYGGPQAAVPVTLLRDLGLPKAKKSAKGKAPTPPPVPVAQTVTDDKGQFKFSKIAPGKYIVTATALIHNKNRDAQVPVTFVNPEEVQPVTLTLK